MSCQAAKRALPVLLCLISTCDCFLSSHGLMRAVFRAPSCGRRSHLAPIRGLRAQAAGEEWELTNEQCDLLQLPRGTKMVGEMSESMEARLSTMGTYEESNPIRYFGNEKFRKENYFGKKKLEVNANRMAAKVRRAEIEERMDKGYTYDQAVREVDGIIKASEENTARGYVPPPAGARPAASALRDLFAVCDSDGSGALSEEEVAKAFGKLRPGGDPAVARADALAVLSAMDADRSGAIEVEEFVAAAELFLDAAPGAASAPAGARAAGGLGSLFGGLFGGGGSAAGGGAPAAAPQVRPALAPAAAAACGRVRSRGRQRVPSLVGERTAQAPLALGARGPGA